MTARTPECPRCGKKMDPGYVIDHTHGGLTRSSWVEGTPVPSFWLGLKVKEEQKLAVTTYRCPKCGYLESYALPA